MSKILVTGGTGLVGSHLLYLLVKNGIHPIATKRENSDILNVQKIFSYYSKNYKELFKKISWEECDILDLLQLETIIQKIEYIYHCAAFISFNSNDEDQMININTTGTANIIDLSLKYKIKKLCYVSSIATLGPNNNLPINENCIWDWTNESSYAKSKYLAEMEVWRGFAEGLKGIIVNPSLIIGPGSWDSGIGTIIKKVNWGMPFYSTGSCGLIGVNDLVEVMFKLMNSNISNERFIVNSEHMTYKKLMTIIAQTLNKQAPYIKLNKHFMKLFIMVDMLINWLRNKRIELSVDAVQYTTTEIKLSSEKINNTIKHRYNSIEDYLKECANFFLIDN